MYQYLGFNRGMDLTERLTLSRTKVSDAGLLHIQKLVNLRALDLRETLVSDAGLLYLQRLAALEHLNLRGTQVSDVGIDDLRHRLPSCSITK